MADKDLFAMGWSDEEILRFLIDEVGMEESFARLHLAAGRGQPFDDVVEENTTPPA
jgi:hypothetical protein